MPAEHLRPEGLSQGYFCWNCGGHCNYFATGHAHPEWPLGDEPYLCKSNPELVAILKELNK